MTDISRCTVLFADLRGSTALFETLGNAAATTLVTQCVAALGRPVLASGGHVVKTLGDGLMAVFPHPAAAIAAAAQMHESMETVFSAGQLDRAAAGLRELRVQVGVAHGEIVQMAGDCFGDAVNVAARLLDHAGDNETLITADVLRELPAEQRARYRSLDKMVLRGRVEPVQVHVLGGRRGADLAVTQFGEVTVDTEPEGLRLGWQGSSRFFPVQQMPVVLGRSPQAAFFVDDSRVSRSHARVDWHGGGFQLSDLSYNGTYVRFNDGEIVSLRRGSCALHGSGEIGLGSSPSDPLAASVRFDVLRLSDDQPDTTPGSLSAL